MNATVHNGDITVTIDGEEAVIEEDTFTGWAEARCSDSTMVYFYGGCGEHL